VSLKQILFFTLTIVLLVIVSAIAGCSTKQNPQSVASQSNVPPPASSGPVAALPLPPLPPGKHAAITADPNPIKVCDGSGLGVTHIRFKIEPPVGAVDVRIDSPAGPQFASKGESARVPTGKWVTDGMVFYLQDTTGGKSLTPENTLDTVTLKVTTDGCQ
jgi:hypothetical protein